nr:phospholipase-like protein [Tanacetum cinerariifolium]
MKQEARNRQRMKATENFKEHPMMLQDITYYLRMLLKEAWSPSVIRTYIFPVRSRNGNVGESAVIRTRAACDSCCSPRGRGRRTKNKQEDEDIESGKEENYKHLTEKMSMIYTSTPRSLTIIDRPRLKIQDDHVKAFKVYAAFSSPSESVNERRRTMFRLTMFGKWLDFPEYSNENLLLNYIFQHEVKQVQNNDVCPPIRYKIGNNHFEFSRQEFCLITGFAFGKIPKADTFHGLQNSPFCDRVFPDKISKPLKKVRALELLGLIKSPKKWYALSDKDSVKVCLLLVSNIVFMGREPKNYIVDNLIELVDDLTACDANPWGEYFLRALYRRLVNVISRHEVAVMLKKKILCPSRKKTNKIDSSEYVGFDFDDAENDSLSDMVKTGEEEIHLDGLEIVDDPFVQTLVKQNSE